MALRLLLWLSVAGLLSAQDVEVPFDFLHNQIVLRATVGGEGPLLFLLDTGTHDSILDLALARRLQLPLSAPSVDSSGLGSDRVLVRSTTIPQLQLGSLTVRRMPATALDLTRISRTLGRPLSGVLGSSFLRTRITQIDYFHRVVRFLARSPFSPPQPANTPRRVAFPLRSRERSVLPVLEDCRVNDTKIPVTIDTGSSAGLILFPRAIALLGLEDLARQGIPLDAAGYRGKARLTKGWLRSLMLGGIDLGAIEVAYVQEGYGDNEDPRRRGGNLGNAVLQDFTLTLDYVNRVVVLESNEQ